MHIVCHWTSVYPAMRLMHGQSSEPHAWSRFWLRSGSFSDDMHLQTFMSWLNQQLMQSSAGSGFASAQGVSMGNKVLAKPSRKLLQALGIPAAERHLLKLPCS